MVQKRIFLAGWKFKEKKMGLKTMFFLLVKITRRKKSLNLYFLTFQIEDFSWQ